MVKGIPDKITQKILNLKVFARTSGFFQLFNEGWRRPFRNRLLSLRRLRLGECLVVRGSKKCWRLLTVMTQQKTLVDIAGTDFNWSKHTCVRRLDLNALPSSVGRKISSFFFLFSMFDRKKDIPKYLRKVMMLTYRPRGKLSIWFEVLKHENI